MTSTNPDGERFTPKVTVLNMCEEQIRLRADIDPAFSVHPCDRDGDPLAEHISLTISLRHRRDGSVRGARVIACERGKEG